MTFKKGDVCIVLDFQDFGEVKVKLIRRIVKRVYPFKFKLWEVNIFSAKYDRFNNFIHSKKYNHKSIVLENDLIKVVG